MNKIIQTLFTEPACAYFFAFALFIAAVLLAILVAITKIFS